MTFKNKKIPKHLILQEEFEIRENSKFGLVKLIVWSLLLVSITYGLLLFRT